MDVIAQQKEAAERSLRQEFAYQGCSGFIMLWAADELEKEPGVLAGHVDGEPAHEAEVDVVAVFEAEVRRVEVEGLILVEYGHRADVEAGDVGGSDGHDPTEGQPRPTSPKRLTCATRRVAGSTPR